MIRLGLCCIFRKEPIKFRITTATALQKLGRTGQLERLSGICHENSRNLIRAVHFIHEHGIGAFRITSPFFPLFTHPEAGYRLEDLPDHKRIEECLEQVKLYCEIHDIRLSFHPDQFNVLSSPHRKVVENTRRELEYQGYLAEMIGAELINLHGGGGYNDKKTSLQRFTTNFHTLSPRVRKRITLENDDTIYTVRDLIPVCEELNIAFAYDVHHHRCNPDGFGVCEATQLALETWKRLNREPYFHLSSPRNGWLNGTPKPHADYIDPADFPDCWKELDLTVDVEAKAKELAVLALKKALKMS